MSERDEFEYGDELPSGGAKRFAAAVTVVVFGLCIFGSAIVDAAMPVEPPKLIGAEKAQEDARRAQASLWDGSLARVVEDDLRERSRVRREVLPTYALMKYLYLGEGSESVFVGAEGWAFLRNRVELAPFDEERLAELTANLFCAVDRRLANRGVGLVLMPIPRKAWVAREFLPRGVDAQLAVDDLLIDGLLERGITTADLRPVYSSRDPEEIYFKTDTHWTPTGAWLTAEEAVRVAFPARTEPKLLGEVKISTNTDSRHENDLLRALGVTIDAFGLGALHQRDPKRYSLQLPPEISKWYEQQTPEVAIAQSGTSFSHQQLLAHSLTHFSGQPVWNGAVPAAPFLGTTVRLFRAHRKVDTLRRVFIEFPIGPTYNKMKAGEAATFGTELGMLFSENPPRELEVISALPGGWRGFQGKTLEVKPGAPAQLLEIPAGFLAHDGRGSACISLKGEVTGSPITLEVLHAGHRMFTTMPTGAVDAVFPLISPGPTSSPVHILARTKRKLSLRVDQLAMAHEPGPGVAHELRAEVNANGVLLRPEAPIPLGQRSALLITLGQGVPPSGKVEVKVYTSTSSEPQTSTFEKLKPNARIFLDLGRAPTGDFLRAEVSAPGTIKPATLATAARLTGA